MSELETECVVYFFFQAEDGIRDRNVTGVQTCALPICDRADPALKDVLQALKDGALYLWQGERLLILNDAGTLVDLEGKLQIGRASCRERVEMSGVGGFGEEKRISSEAEGVWAGQRRGW